MVESAGVAIAVQVLALPELAGARIVACTIAMPGVPPTAALIAGLRDRGVTVLVPRIEPARQLSWHELRESTIWRRHPFGIDEPAGEPRPQGLGGVDAVIVPALAIGSDGARLGQGGGYYDRALAAASGALLIGTVFEDEVLDTVPCEPHDARVAIIVTPGSVRRVRAPA